MCWEAPVTFCEIGAPNIFHVSNKSSGYHVDLYRSDEVDECRTIRTVFYLGLSIAFFHVQAIALAET